MQTQRHRASRLSTAFIVLHLAACASSAVDGDASPPLAADLPTVEDILGGVESDASEDFVVLIEVTDTAGNVSTCTGALIHEHAVVTAQHCLGRREYLSDGDPRGHGYWKTDTNLRQILVAFGPRGDTRFGATNATGQYVHYAAWPDGSTDVMWTAANERGDIALLYLPEPVTNIRPALLDGVSVPGINSVPVGDGSNESPIEMQVAGWGNITDTEVASSRQTRSTRVVAREDVEAQLLSILGPAPAQEFASNAELLATEGGVVCNGDSGGPAYLQSVRIPLQNADGTQRIVSAGPWLVAILSSRAAALCSDPRAYSIAERVRSYDALFRAPVWRLVV